MEQKGLSRENMQQNPSRRDNSGMFILVDEYRLPYHIQVCFRAEARKRRTQADIPIQEGEALRWQIQPARRKRNAKLL